MDRTLASLHLAALLAFVACDPSEPVEFRSKKKHEQGPSYPGKHWQEGKPEKHGLSPEGLDDLFALAEELDSSCLMVIHDGKLVAEWYGAGSGPDTVHDNLFSITKSVTSTLVGIAEAQDLLDLDEQVCDFIDPWMGSASAGVTVRNLLSNDSGRHWSFESDYMNMMWLPNQTEYAIGLDQAVAPGEWWEYNNAAIQTLEEVLEQATGEDVDDFAQTHLFEPLGMTASLGRDQAGNPLMYQGLSTSCSDLARLGHLILNDGKWKNEQIVPKSWVKKATKPSTDLNDAYGFLWWLNRSGHVVEPSFPNRVEYDGKLVPASDGKLVLAAGAFGQMLAIDREDRYVVVRLQKVDNLVTALQTDPDPVGLSKIEALMTLFEEAKD